MYRIEVNYWKVDDPILFAPGAFPTFLYADKANEFYYGLPIEEYPGLLKVSNNESVVFSSDFVFSIRLLK